MQPTTEQLEAAFKRSKLACLGYTFKQAIDCEAIKTCLVRMALNAMKPKQPVKTYWYNNI